MFKVLLDARPDHDPVEVQLEQVHGEDPHTQTVLIDENKLPLEHATLRPGAGWLTLRGRVFPYFAARVDDAVHVWLDGRVHVLPIVQRTPQRATDAAATSQSETVTAPMPGTILRIDVQPGDAVTAHQPLIIMESMKMEMTLSVPHAGRVAGVACEVGQLVQTGDVLVQLEEQDADA
jgi:acetyl/propionyl-CoA carboxylase alpha subunit